MNFKSIMHPSIPKYVQLIEILKAEIQQQILTPGQQLPNEDDLALHHGMSRGTVRKAISELQRMGLVRKEQGRGTFINEAKPALSGFSLVEFDQYTRLQNRVPSTRTIVFEVMPATQAVASKLELSETRPVIHIIQLRLADRLPVVYEERYFDASLCPSMTRDELEKSSIHRLLIEKYQIPLIRLSHDIEITSLSEEMFDVFEVNESVKVFAVNRLSYTQINDTIRPAVWYQALYRADDYQFQAQFHTSI